MKFIFLDVDGVLNTIDTVMQNMIESDRKVDKKTTLNLNSLENLYNIVMETDAFIVITSEWRRSSRLMKELLEGLALFNLTNRVIGKTERIVVRKESKGAITTHVDRGLEIEDYLNKHDCDSFVILDDIKWDLEKFEDNLILTDPRYGITNKDVEEAIRILNVKDNALGL